MNCGVYWIHEGVIRIPDEGLTFNVSDGTRIERRRVGITLNVPICPRCGSIHDNVVFTKLERQIVDCQWWALCPVLGEPILGGRV